MIWEHSLHPSLGMHAMATNRRDFLRLSIATGAFLAALEEARGGTSLQAAAGAKPPKKLRMLVFGGTGFIGPELVKYALSRGHEVTLFNRGKTNPHLFPDQEKIIGDRNPDKGEGLKGLEGKTWDVAFDDSGYYPRHVKASAELLAKAGVAYYLYVSSVSAYASFTKDGQDESAPTAKLPPPTFNVVLETAGDKKIEVIKEVRAITNLDLKEAQELVEGAPKPVKEGVSEEVAKALKTQLETAGGKVKVTPVETMGPDYQNYGGLKALCEEAVQAAFPQKCAVVRPGYIVGPGDPTDRFTYWPVRISRGGDALIPGTADDPIQVIDVRDLAEWMVRLAEASTLGMFNACGPEKKLAWGTVIDACAKACDKPAKVHWASVEELQGEKVPPLPIWAPPTGEEAGVHTVSNARAMAAGLTFRPIQTTVSDTLAWFNELPEDRQKAFKAPLSEEEEQRVLKSLGRI
jgi:ribosomal protein L7/L12